MSLITFVIVLNLNKDFQSFIGVDNITIYLILTSIIVIGNIVMSLIFYFKK